MYSPRKKTPDDDCLNTPLYSPQRTATGSQILNESPSTLQAGQRRQADVNGRTRTPPSPVIFESWRISTNDTTEIILPATLKRYGIDALWESFSLWLVCDDMEIEFGMAEKPSILFKQLRKDGKDPMFMLRRKGSLLDLNPKRAPPERPLTTKSGIDKALPRLPSNSQRSIQEDMDMSNSFSSLLHPLISNDENGHERVKQQYRFLHNGLEDDLGSLDHQVVTLPLASDSYSEQGNPDANPDLTHNLKEDNEPPQRHTELQYTSQPISDASPRLPSFGDLQVDFSELEIRFAEGVAGFMPGDVEGVEGSTVLLPAG